MAKKMGGLGRGLGELFQQTDAEAVGRAVDAAMGFAPSATLGDGSWYEELPIAAIHPNPAQPRQEFDMDALEELAESIADVGLLQPIVVRQKGAAYEIIMGERRWRAGQLAGLERIPAIVRATDDEDMLRDALFENLHRVQLNPIEEAAAYQQLLDDFGGTQEELATRLHKSRPHISNTLRLLKLPTAVQRKVAAGVISAGHARALLALSDAAIIEHLTSRIISEGLSVRNIEELVTWGEFGANKARKSEPTPATDPEIEAQAARIADALDTRVKVSPGKSKGRIIIEYADLTDLQRIADLITDSG
ncbi:MAG: ParB/RepB/Spo0J family partition protein [Propionibacteriaceae bacterium]|jgi:ParB family chromosome partitioning protein|nr:ParB/RepB/Spo0J family partition protein [Propionibacteriaceae bacterium]